MALEFGERWLSYGELQRRARRLARRLCEAGCGCGDRVGLYVDRSPEMVLATLAAAHAAAYVPLDPSYPAPRLSFMIEDTAMPVLIVEPHLVEHVPLSEARMVVLESGQIARRSASRGSG